MTVPSTRPDSALQNPRFWLAVAFLGSLLAHVALWFWFQQVYLPQRALPSKEKLELRKFKVERVEVNPRWLEPRLPPIQRVAPAPSTDRTAPTPTEETRTFARLLAQTPSSPTLPAGAPAIPQDKPKLSLGENPVAPPDLFSHVELDRELASQREALFNRSTRAPPAGRPILGTPGAPVMPKSGSKEIGLPTQGPPGPSQGTDVGDPSKFSGSSRAEDFFGAPGGQPPPPPATPAKPLDVAKLVPQGLPDKPKGATKYPPLNPFLNVELFTQERVREGRPPEGYFLIRITAKPNPQLSIVPKDVFLVLDVSSSIGGKRLEVFRNSVQALLAQLNPADRLRLMAFNDRLFAFREEWLPAASLPTADIRAWLGKLRSGGVTDFYESMRPLSDYHHPAGRMAMALVMSDGIPTTGLVDSTQIINELSGNNDNNVSIFTLSTGNDVNDFLLDLLSYRNQGWLGHADRLPDAAEAFQRLIRQVRNPLFLNLRFRFAGVDDRQVFPQNLPNLYQDSPLLLFGRYTPGQTSTISLQILGESADTTRELLVQLPVPLKPNGPDTLATTWARQRIYDLLSRMTSAREGHTRILDEVKQVSQEYGVDVPYFR